MDESTALPAYDQGHFPVEDGHRLYYERYGKQGGIPVLFVHGGPGAGFSEDDKRFFDPEVFDVLLFEQRGAGRSEPFASLEHNHTDALVGDMERLLDAFSLEDVLLFGGSWGSTLSLVYAVRHPDRIRAALLRGIFLADDASITHFVEGGVGQMFPDVWERFLGMVPESRRGEVADFYLEAMSADDDRAERFCYEWARYELSLISLDFAESDIDARLEHYNYRSLAPLEAHYMANRCFLPEDYILNHAERLSEIPVSIVHGRYDVICPAQQAFMLHRALPKARLQFVTAGHSSSEPAIRAALTAELSRFAERE